MQIAVRDAIRGALDEEMDRDPRVIIMGEEVARYQGAYKVMPWRFASFVLFLLMSDQVLAIWLSVVCLSVVYCCCCGCCLVCGR